MFVKNKKIKKCTTKTKPTSFTPFSITNDTDTEDDGTSNNFVEEPKDKYLSGKCFLAMKKIIKLCLIFFWQVSSFLMT